MVKRQVVISVIGFGIEIVFGILGIVVEAMPMPITILGLAVGVGMIVWGVISLFGIEWQWPVRKLDRKIVSTKQPEHGIPPVLFGAYADLVPLPIRAKDAKDILMIGRTLSGVVHDNLAFLQRRLQNEATIRLAVIDKDWENGTIPKAMHDTLETTDQGLLTELGTFFQDIIRMKAAEKWKGQLEVRLITHAPTFSIVVTDGDLSSGQIVVGLLPYKTSPSERPHLFVRPENISWFPYFHDMAGRIWREAKPYVERFTLT